VRVSLTCVAVNFILNIVLGVFTPLAHVGIALATALGAWLNTTLLATTLLRRGHFAPDARLKSKTWRICAAALVMATALVLGRTLLAAPLADGEIARALALTVLVAGGLATFGLLALALRAAEWRDIRSRLPLTRRRA
jgi:putative peptidoglycan lipid II flippase